MPTLDPGQIKSRLAALPGWEYRQNAITKQYTMKEFMDAVRLVNRVAELAEAADHHPDILINYRRVTFTCSTHSEGGVTEKDLSLASRIEQAYNTARAK